MKRGKRRRRRTKEIDARIEALRSSGLLPDKRFRKRRKAGALGLTVLLLAGVLYAAYLITTYTLGAEEPVAVVVEEGDTLSSVADKLEEAGVISSSTLFEFRVRLEGAAAEIKPGEYSFEPGQDADEILEALAGGDSVSALTVSIPEGLTLEQTAQRVAEQSGVPAEDFEAAARSTDYGYAFLDAPDIQTTEGFLFPKQYRFERDDDASRIVDRLLEQYLVETGDLDFAEAQDRLNLTGYELLTSASLIEKESANAEERPIIASVIYNRLRAGMPLQIDATVQYARGDAKEELSLEDLEIDSPYNTYANVGLPPAPISSPSRESIEAALQPDDTDYLYYVLEPNGEEHFFTDDYDEFLNAKQKRDAASLTIAH